MNLLSYSTINCKLLQIEICFSDNDIESVLDHTFCVESHSFGKHQQHELKPGGGDIKVTEENKKEYVK